MTTELLEKAIESVGGAEEFRRKREEFRRDLIFIEENIEKLVEDYNEKWVAVYNSEVVAHGRNYRNILFQLEKRGMPIDQIPIRYLSRRKVFALYLQP
jgi:hypothetical protein